MAQQCAPVCLNCLCNALAFGYVGRDFGHIANRAHRHTHNMLDMKHICIVFGETFCINHVPNRCYQ